MPTALGPEYSVSWRGRPAHMLKVDIPIWYAFLEEHADKFISLHYDCLLGGPAFTPFDYPEKLRSMWQYLGSKRADVIAFTQDEVWIIEVTNESKVKALGQLMLYKQLWLEDPKSPKPVKLVLVCDFEDPAITAGAMLYSIMVFIIREGKTSTKTE